MNKKKALLEFLADGKFHSGTKLAQALGVSRMAVWKQVQSLRGYGLDIFSVKRKGYRLSQPMDLLDVTRIRQMLATAMQTRISTLEVAFVAESTNRYLMDKLPRENIHGHVVLAEYQSAGKGSKDNRTWVSPLGGGIYLSIGWHFDTYPNSFTALSLATGVAVAGALQQCGVEGLGLKWPNDIVSQGSKLGGILIESRGITTSHCDIVIGIGINVRIPEQVHALIGQPFTDISRLVRTLPSRNQLVAAIISATIGMLIEFDRHGFSRFIDEWRRLDLFVGKEASLVFPDRTLNGRVLGIENNGMLAMSINGRKHQFAGGELSLRSLE
ncbi:MAG: BPL/LPL catalytic protein [Gammaproteobacteria bacterium]|nr:BPL/LPL catalytic protein [Gammaproteobacteria bacterium]